jgi:hypothetical protein
MRSSSLVPSGHQPECSLTTIRPRLRWQSLPQRQSRRAFGIARPCLLWLLVSPSALEQIQAGDDGLDLELKLMVLLFCALGLRVEADRAELARAQRSAVGVDEAHRRADPLVATVTSLTGRHGQAADTEPWMACYAALAQAEWSRLEGRPDPDAWQRAAEHWERLENRYAAAYARFRQAETLLGVRAPRAQVRPVLRAAHQTTVALGAGPLRREIELLADRGRLRPFRSSR